MARGIDRPKRRQQGVPQGRQKPDRQQPDRRPEKPDRRPEKPEKPEKPDKPERRPGVRVGSTGNSPELVETVPIVADAGKGRRVVLSFGPDSKTDSPLPDIKGGDRLEVYAELEVTTDAPEEKHPGRIGNVYGYAPALEAQLLLAADAGITEVKGGRSIALGKAWTGTLSHEQHHGVITFAAALDVPAEGLPWEGPTCVNFVLAASSPEAKQGDLLLIGQNEKTPTVVQDMAGIRVVRTRAGGGTAPSEARDSGCLVAGVPVAKVQTVVFAHRLDGLVAGEQLLVKAQLVTDAAPLGYAARISTRLFLADGPDQTEPGGTASSVASWKGHVSKFTGFNCLPALGPQTTRKFGVIAIKQAPPGPLYLNMVAVSAAPFGGAGSADALPIDASQSYLDVIRYPAELAG